jgi:hypothetical protein
MHIMRSPFRREKGRGVGRISAHKENFPQRAPATSRASLVALPAVVGRDGFSVSAVVLSASC